MKKKNQRTKKENTPFWTKEKADYAVNLFLVVLLALGITVLLNLHMDRLPQNLQVGSIAPKDIKADQNYEIVDEQSTQKLREQAEASILPVFDFDPTIEIDLVNRIKESFSKSRQMLYDGIKIKAKAKIKASEKEQFESKLKSEFVTAFGFNLDDESYALFRKSSFHPSMEKTLTFLIHRVSQFPIIHAVDELNAYADRGIILRRLSFDDTLEEEVIKDVSLVLDVNAAKKKIEEISLSSISGFLNLELLDASVFNFTKNVASALVKVSMNYNGLETDMRKQRARANVKNTIIKVKRGESIIRSGDRLEPWHLTVIEGIRKELLKTNHIYRFIGLFLFVSLVLFIVFFYAQRYIRRFKPNRKDLIFLGLTLITSLLILRMGVFISTAVRDALPFTIGTNTLYYVIPVASGAMLVRFILNSEAAFIFSVMVSLFSGVYLGNSLEMMVFYLISSVYAAHVVARVDRRSTLFRGGLMVGMVNAVTLSSLSLISSAAVLSRVEISLLATNMIFGICGGLITPMLVLILSPIVEGLFNYTTDIKLLELANLSHPLLKKMLLSAPGTYHHSQMVGVLAEAGAQAIEANPLVARVGSYYHDIGKMKKPQYFIENQRGENPHDKLAPSMSALIIEAHVKDGLEMARLHKLPSKIVDMIPEHQGTKLIGFFYNKAKKMEDPALGGRVEEEDYRYMGPKPQTKEAGVVMLADAVEAAVRTLQEKSPAKIRTTVEKLVNQHFVDEQLDECDLTLRDIHQIADAFVKILIGIYHQRVEYPEGALVSGMSHAVGAHVHSIHDKVKTNENHSHQQPSQAANISPLFRKKD